MNSQNKLMELRLRRGLTQQAVAEQLDVSRQAISRWETGSAAPTRDKMQAIARLYDVPLSYLYDDDAVLATAETQKLREQEFESLQREVAKRAVAVRVWASVAAVLLVLVIALALRLQKDNQQRYDIAGMPVAYVGDEDYTEFDLVWEEK